MSSFSRHPGDSLCQKVLDDDLVAIGRGTPNFQIMHGIYCLEQAILELKRRKCNFEIVFFECMSIAFIIIGTPDVILIGNIHGTIMTGSDELTVSSRLLAREVMKSHISQLTKTGKICSAFFQNLEDPEWHRYVKDKRVTSFASLASPID